MKRRALTLIELLVAMGISVVVAGVVANVFVDSWNAQIGQEAYSELQQKSRLAVDEISSTIQISSGVAASVNSGGTTYTSSANTLVLKTPALDNGNNILSGTDYIIFRRKPLELDKLERIIIADAASTRASLPSPSNVTNEIGTLQFRYYNSSGIELVPGSGDLTTAESVYSSIETNRTVRNRIVNRRIDNRVYLRNN